MEIAFIMLSVLTLGAAILAMRLRNLIHCALCLAVALAGLGGFYLLLNAEFVAFAQILVYLGAVTILVVFAILLTRGSEPESGEPVFGTTWFKGLLVVTLVCGSLILPVLTTPKVHRALTQKPVVQVKQIGDKLMSTHVLALEVIGLLLTAALVGAVVIAMPEEHNEPIEKEEA